MQLDFIEIGCCLLLHCSCSTKTRLSDPSEHFKVITTVEVETVTNLDDYGIFMPIGLAAHSGRFYIQVPGKEIIKEVNIDDSIATTKLITGNGPGEFIAPSYLTTSGHKATLIDINRMIIAEIDMLQNEDNVAITDFHEERGPFISAIATTNCLILSGIFESGRYMYYDRDNGDIKYFGEYRLGGHHKNLRNLEKSQVYINTKLGIKPDMTMFAAINFNCGVIDINKIVNDSIIHIKGLDFHYPEVAVKNNRIGQSIDNRNGFIDIAASDNCIYVIYSGKTYREHGPDFTYCDWLMTFDWNGSPITCYKLPIPFNVICYDTIKEELYGVSSAVPTTLYRLNLSF